MVSVLSDNAVQNLERGNDLCIDDLTKDDTAPHRRSKRRVRVISKDSEDHDIGRRLDRGGRAHEFTTKRLDLGLDCSLVLKGVSPSSGEVVSAS